MGLFNEYYEYSLVLGDQEAFDKTSKKKGWHILKYWTIEIAAPPCAFAAPPPPRFWRLARLTAKLGTQKGSGPLKILGNLTYGAHFDHCETFVEKASYLFACEKIRELR